MKSFIICSPLPPNAITVVKSSWLRWVGHVARMGEKRYKSRVLGLRPEGRRPLGRPRQRWENNIKMYMKG